MTADEVREVLKTELGGPFTETTWKRFYKDDVEYFLEHQSPEAWQSLKDVAEDLFEYEKELIKELASGVVTEPGTRRRRLGQRKSGKKGAAEEHWFPDLSPGDEASRRSLWRIPGEGCRRRLLRGSLPRRSVR